MEAKANAKFVRISPRKVNVVLDLVRGKDVKYAEAVLKHTPKAACEPLLKLLKRYEKTLKGRFGTWMTKD